MHIFSSGLCSPQTRSGLFGCLKTRKDWRSASPPSLPLASCFSYCGSGRSSASSSGPTQPSDTHQPTRLVIGPLHPHVRSSLSSTQLLLDSSFLVVFKDKKDWRSASPPSSPLASCCSYYDSHLGGSGGSLASVKLVQPKQVTPIGPPTWSLVRHIKMSAPRCGACSSY
ncbi:hypothetical protein GQ55_8G123000 [Panicum hallii var. hallii]|uniref:Uncharacterized protein n=1 Tax=Panicum hallii var. hallii TaxID=1504633 RepID=A0A2T7CMS2_9POAL|nr:hypothetical protein GQ55_8G123000 [Panicum hallii var. hallii]